jgi:hypothetical protein
MASARAEPLQGRDQFVSRKIRRQPMFAVYGGSNQADPINRPLIHRR